HNSFEAGLAKARLEDEGVMSFIMDTDMSWLGGIVPIRLMVDDEDLEAAVGILRADPDKGEAG
ncbi:MAG TPA: DUF2007 domain-containing protein, partial [Allosphingosinicella sp.]|nr:DUF2007 domain-containing protein [Allosphingosinicella sp.]